MKNNRARVFIVLCIVSIALAYSFYHFIFRTSNLTCNSENCIYEVRTITEAKSILQQSGFHLDNETSWLAATKIKQLKTIKPGRYRFNQGMSNSEIISALRAGGEATITLRIDDVTHLEELSGKLGKYLLHDSSHFMNAFSNDSLLTSLDTEKLKLATIIRPNTYEFYWNMTGESFLMKMKSETDKMWNVERQQACDKIGMKKEEVVILASIVKGETASLEEAPRIAGLYLNRLKIGMPLQSDPTAIFMRRAPSQRVYLSDIQSDNPYNTYKFQGLPPGPINFPETNYIDAVLKAEQHNFLFMCAEPGGTGRHRFARNLADHEKNRRQYVTWLDKQGIR
jgi:UPF0755 protein